MHSICEWLQHNQTILLIVGWPPLAAALEVIHYVGVFILVGSVVLVDLRVMGIAARRRKIGELAAQMFPYAWFGLGMIVVSGFMMFTTSAADYYASGTFHQKMEIMLLGLIAAGIIQKSAPKWERAGSIPISGKVLAFLCAVFMFASIVFGNLVPALSGIG